MLPLQYTFCNTCCEIILTCLFILFQFEGPAKYPYSLFPGSIHAPDHDRSIVFVIIAS